MNEVDKTQRKDCIWLVATPLLDKTAMQCFAFGGAVQAGYYDQQSRFVCLVCLSLIAPPCLSACVCVMEGLWRAVYHEKCGLYLQICYRLVSSSMLATVVAELRLQLLAKQNVQDVTVQSLQSQAYNIKAVSAVKGFTAMW